MSENGRVKLITGQDGADRTPAIWKCCAACLKTFESKGVKTDALGERIRDGIANIARTS